MQLDLLGLMRKRSNEILEASLLPKCQASMTWTRFCSENEEERMSPPGSQASWIMREVGKSVSCHPVKPLPVSTSLYECI